MKKITGLTIVLLLLFSGVSIAHESSFSSRSGSGALAEKPDIFYANSDTPTDAVSSNYKSSFAFMQKQIADVHIKDMASQLDKKPPILSSPVMTKKEIQKKAFESISKILYQSQPKSKQYLDFKNEIITNSVPDRPFVETVTPIEGHDESAKASPFRKVSLVQRSGVRVVRTADGFEKIKDYDKGTLTMTYRGKEIKLIIDKPEDCDCDEELWSDPNALMLKNMLEPWVQITYNRFDVFVDLDFYNSQPANTFEDLFDLFEPRYEYLEQHTKWNTERFFNHKLGIQVTPVSETSWAGGCVSGLGGYGNAYIALHDNFSDPEVCKYPYYENEIEYFDNQGDLGDHWWYMAIIIHEAVHAISPFALMQAHFLTEGFSTYHQCNILTYFSDINQETSDTYIYQGNDRYNWPGYIANDYHDTSPWQNEIPYSSGYYITSYMFNMLRDDYSLDWNNFYNIVNTNHESLDKAYSMYNGVNENYNNDVVFLDIFAKALDMDFESELKPIFRYDGPSGPGWGVRQWGNRDWYADLTSVISFSNHTPAPDGTTDIITTVHNNGETSLVSVPVNIYNGTTLIDSLDIDVASQDITIISTPFTQPEGVYNITVIVDKYDIKLETDNSNNETSQSVTFNCCNNLRGNADGDLGDKTDVDDLVYMVDFAFKGGDPVACLEEGDVDASGVIDVDDLVFMVDFAFKGGEAPGPCP